MTKIWLLHLIYCTCAISFVYLPQIEWRQFTFCFAKIGDDFSDFTFFVENIVDDLPFLGTIYKHRRRSIFLPGTGLLTGISTKTLLLLQICVNVFWYGEVNRYWKCYLDLLKTIGWRQMCLWWGDKNVHGVRKSMEWGCSNIKLKCTPNSWRLSIIINNGQMYHVHYSLLIRDELSRSTRAL